MDRDPTRRNQLLFACAVGLLGVHAAYYYPFISDDALISLRYARRLSQGLGLTWTDGEFVDVRPEIAVTKTASPLFVPAAGGTVTNYPNPFHPDEAPTTIAYVLDDDARVLTPHPGEASRLLGAPAGREVIGGIGRSSPSIVARFPRVCSSPSSSATFAGPSPTP